MLRKKSKFDLLHRSHQRACHDFWLHRSRGFSLSEETYKFINDNPSFLFSEFDSEFERDPFQKQLGNPRNFFCPDSRHSPSNRTPPRTPPYSTLVDIESDLEADSDLSTMPPKKNSSKVEVKDRSRSNSSFVRKTIPTVNSVSDSILNTDGEPIDFHEDRSGETILLMNKRDHNTKQPEPNFDHFEELNQPCDSGSSSHSDDDHEDNKGTEVDSPPKKGKVTGVQLGFSELPWLRTKSNTLCLFRILLRFVLMEITL
jgi:hypothetical protein